jgi:CubicO group peptidase (beta-lactamase class C family)
MDFLTGWRIPGNDISVWIDNKEVFRYQSGYMDVENKIKMTDDCLMNIYSSSKVMTAVAGMQLLEQGKFVLNTPLYDFIPEFKEMYIDDGNGNLKKAENTITMRHIFTMTSGMTYSISDELKKEAEIKTNGKFNTVEVIKTMAKTPLSFEPGTTWQYSYGHDVLAAVVEVISGKKFRDYVNENICQPLGMKETYFHSSEETDKRFAPQYHFVLDNNTDGDEKKGGGYTQSVDMSKCGGHLVRTDGVVSHRFGEEYDSGGAGIITSVTDYSKLANALANSGLGSTGERILSPYAINLMKQNQLSETQRKTFSWPQLAGYGYGLGVRTMINKAEGGSMSSLGEFGWGGAAGSSVYVDTDLKLGVFYAHHMLNQQESYYQPRLRNVIYSCLD